MTWHDRQPYVDKLAPGVHAFIQPDGGSMVNNCGVIADPSGFALLVDTSSTERPTRSLLAEAAAMGADVPRVAVNTHHPDHIFGNEFLPAETLVIAHDKRLEEVIEAGPEATEVIATAEYGDLTGRPAAFVFPDRLPMHIAGFRLEVRHAGQPARTTNEFSSRAESERFVGNLHRAYAELEHPNGEWSRLPVPSVWPDMVSFNGGPIECHT